MLLGHLPRCTGENKTNQPFFRITYLTAKGSNFNNLFKTNRNVFSYISVIIAALPPFLLNLTGIAELEFTVCVLFL